MNHIFTSKAPSQPPLVENYVAAHPDVFDNPAAAARYLKLIFFPPSRRWRYQLNGKSGNTFVLNLLFEIEFGGPFTCRVDPSSSGNQHPDFALFQLADAGLLSNAFGAGDGMKDIEDFPGLSLATVRDPWTRIVSAFLYLCRSHELGDTRFLAERIRLNALCRFDWNADRNTAVGFRKFAEYIDLITREFGPDMLDAHWLPQARHIRPDLYRPDILGRTEALDAFADEVQDALGVTPRIPPSRLRNNARGGPRIDTGDFTSDPRVRAIVRRVYEEDFDRFGYSTTP